MRALNELADKRPDPIPPDSPVGRPSSPALDAYWALDYLRANDLLDRLEPGYPLRPACDSNLLLLIHACRIHMFLFLKFIIITNIHCRDRILSYLSLFQQ